MKGFDIFENSLKKQKTVVESESVDNVNAAKRRLTACLRITKSPYAKSWYSNALKETCLMADKIIAMEQEAPQSERNKEAVDGKDSHNCNTPTKQRN